MPDLPQGFYVGDIYCFPTGPQGAGTFGYIPGLPAIEFVDGSVKASLLSSPAAGVLSLQAVWTADPQAIEAVEKEIRNRYPEVATIDLGVADLSDTMASLTVTNANGAAFTFGPSETSGPDAFRVVFSETLTAAEKLAAISAFRGQAGVLQLCYRATLTLRETATAELAGDLAEAVKALAPKTPEKKPGGFFGFKKEPDPPSPPPPNLAACTAELERALSSGKLRITRSDTPNSSAAARQQTETALRGNAAKMVYDKLVQMGPDAVYMSSFALRQKTTAPENVSYQVSRTSDPAAWLAQNGGGQLIAEAGAVMPEPNR